MNIVEWFNPESREHLRAYRHLERRGFWPEGFVPDGIEMPNVWQVSIMQKIVNEFLINELGPDYFNRLPGEVPEPGSYDDVMLGCSEEDRLDSEWPKGE